MRVKVNMYLHQMLLNMELQCNTGGKTPLCEKPPSCVKHRVRAETLDK